MKTSLFDRKIFSWCLFDFANSSYSAVIAAVIFPVYYTTVVVGNDANLGDLWWGRAISVSMAFVALSSPFLGGISDYARAKKKFLVAYTLLCVLATAFLALVDRGMVMAGFVLLVLANVGMEGGIVFYNSFLNDIADNEHQGRVSAWGYATGYLGSIISLAVALILVKTDHITFVWPMVAVFFVVFSLPAFIFLPADQGKGQKLSKAARDGFATTWGVLKRMWSDRDQRRFLLAYFLYEDGVNTVIVFSSIFASTTLGFTSEQLIGLYLVVQVTALAGAFLMARPIDYWGPKKVVSLSLILWMVVTIVVYFIYSKAFFFVAASMAGLGLGTIQAATRAFFAQFIPPGDESKYFGVYSLVGKTSAVVGPLIFGTVSSMTNNQRPAVAAISVLFITGCIILQTVRGGKANVKKTGNG
ncbi:MAG TPA: MFS transporter [Syntrophorhabdaceae bacterium]|nr:MFS transporter [Syntrophorhabdaceae bacterium]